MRVLPVAAVMLSMVGAYASSLLEGSAVGATQVALRAEGKTSGVTLAHDGGSIVLRDGEGRLMAAFSGIELSIGGKMDFMFADIESRGSALKASCRVQGRPPRGVEVPDVVATFAPEGEGVRVRFDLFNVATNIGFKSNLCMFIRRHPDGFARGESAPALSHWVRDRNGGLPYEESIGQGIGYGDGKYGVWYVFGRGMGTNPKWADRARQHLNFVRRGNGAWSSDFLVLASDCRRSAEDVVMSVAGIDSSVSLSTGRTYNWFDDAKSPMSLDAEVRNFSTHAREFRLSWTVRDFDGVVATKGRTSVRIGPRAVVKRNVSFTPQCARNLYFAEFSAVEAASGRESFARTSLALLPPHTFSATPDDSIFGISAYWPIPDEESVQRLMDRMGVMWVRQGDSRLQHAPRIANRHTSVSPSEWIARGRTDAERDAWIRENLAECVRNGNKYWEFCNELNMSTLGIAMEGGGIGKALQAPGYAAWVRRIAEIKKEKPEWRKVQLLTLGIAGTDDAFLRAVATNGVWGAFAGVCEHPGRGNFTPDYPYARPEKRGARLPKEDKASANPSFWNYLGAVRLTRECVSRLDGEFTPGGAPKSLWLTEVYAPTVPNSYWEDTLHSSAENVVLTYALAKAEGVKCAMFYQLFDGVWSNRLGVNPRNREYFFGLVNRDLSFKPALMAYCAIAEALDGAAFIGWAELPARTAHALLFSTPRGGLAIAWDRSEGYVLTDKPAPGTRFRSPEAWVGRWTVETPCRFPANGDVMLVDAIGRARKVVPEAGEVTLRLTGAPVCLYGIDLARIKAL